MKNSKSYMKLLYKISDVLKLYQTSTFYVKTVKKYMKTNQL